MHINFSVLLYQKIINNLFLIYMKINLVFFFTIIILSVNAQQLRQGINKDSLFDVSIKDLPQNLRDSLKRGFKSSSDQEKEFLLFIVTMPRTSKSLMIKNIDSNYANIERLKSEYSKVVPPNYEVQVEFEPANINFGIDESIDLRITKKINNESTVLQDWHLKYGSQRLKEMLEVIHWDDNTLKQIKALLKKANCISIKNGKITEIGFGRNGLGEYSYLIFNHQLSTSEVNLYYDGCNNIFYKRNIVLEYEGGAVGAQCFPEQ